MFKQYRQFIKFLNCCALTTYVYIWEEVASYFEVINFVRLMCMAHATNFKVEGLQNRASLAYQKVGEDGMAPPSPGDMGPDEHNSKNKDDVKVLKTSSFHKHHFVS